jgi:hypothetical protein
MVVSCPFPTRASFTRHAVESDGTGRPQTDEPDPGRVIAPPAPEASPVVAVDADEADTSMNRAAPRWVPRSEWRPEPPAREEYDPLSDRWR